MGVEIFRIVLDKPGDVYHPGETVTGRVELVLSSEKKIRGVELKLMGKAACKWYASGGGGKTVHRRSSSEVYVDVGKMLIGEGEKFKLPAGEHAYLFDITLPSRLPPSFSGSYGEISYYVESKIVIPLGFDKEVRTEFNVISPLNLNFHPRLRAPYKDESSKTFCWMCCARGFLTMAVQLPKTGYATSEVIPITLKMDNSSNVEVIGIYVYLKQTISWTADGYHKHENCELHRVRLEGVEERESQTWIVNLAIPRGGTVSYLDGCSLIQIDHQLGIKALVSGLHTNLKMRIPLTIGKTLLNENSTVPIATPQI